MAKNELTNITWKEIVWHRPFKIEQVIDMLNHLAAMKNRGAIIWEIRANNGKITHLIGTQTRFWNRMDFLVSALACVACPRAASNQVMETRFVLRNKMWRI